ncbi:hypothetical protein [Roseateles sp.]|uniref:hypothetical protein n=1 Tax=Roseateles sp. TaxID=1971397 RepID=UPI002F3E80ED
MFTKMSSNVARRIMPIALLAAFAVAALSACDNKICSDGPSSAFESPAGTFRAELRSGGCGGFSSTETGLVLIKKGSDEIHRGYFGVNARLKGINAKWRDEKHLEISGFQMEDLLWYRQGGDLGIRITLRPNSSASGGQ